MAPKPITFLFAPGAGAPSAHPWMQHWAELLQTVGTVRLLDYPYMIQKSGRPDPLPKLIAAHREALHGVRSGGAQRVVLIGKSMGSRVGCHVSLQEEVDAVVCLGYPLCGGGDPTKLRDQVLREMRTRMLFIQGTRDQLCPLELLAAVRQTMTAPNALHVVQEGDHSLLVTKRQLKAANETQAEVDARILDAICGFLG